MSEDLNEELLSAYLDDEVTAEERAHVDRCLRDSPAWRQLFDELRALRASIVALPRYKLGENLDRSVLAAAEKQLSGPALQTTVPSHPSHAESSHASSNQTNPNPSSAVQSKGGPNAEAADAPVAIDWPQLRLPRGWRAWAWPAAVLAAALLIKVFDTQPQPQKVAQAPPAAEARAPEEPPIHLPGDLSIGGAPSEDEKRSIVHGGREADTKYAGGQPHRMAQDAAGREPAAAPAAAAPADAVSPIADRDATDKFGESPVRPLAVEAGGRSRNDYGFVPDAASNQPAPAGDVPALSPGGMAGKPSSTAAAPRRAMLKAKAGPAPRVAVGKSDGEKIAGGKVDGDKVVADKVVADKVVADKADDANASGLADDDELVVELQLQRNAAARGAFDDVLARNSIVTQAKEQAKDQTKAIRNPDKGVAQTTVESRRYRKAEGESLGAGAVSVIEGPVIEVHVEGSPRQIAATLAEMQQRPDEFAAVVLQPAARSNWQQGLAQYNRIGAPRQTRAQRLNRSGEVAKQSSADEKSDRTGGAAVTTAEQAASAPLSNAAQNQIPQGQLGAAPRAKGSAAPSMQSLRDGAKDAPRADQSTKAGQTRSENQSPSLAPSPADAASTSPSVEAAPASPPADVPRQQSELRQQSSALTDGKPADEPIFAKQPGNEQSAGKEQKVRVVFLLWTAEPNQDGYGKPAPAAGPASAEEPVPAKSSPASPPK